MDGNGLTRTVTYRAGASTGFVVDGDILPAQEPLVAQPSQRKTVVIRKKKTNSNLSPAQKAQVSRRLCRLIFSTPGTCS